MTSHPLDRRHLPEFFAMAEPSWDDEQERDVVFEEKVKTQRPRLFKVLLHNDDYTTTDFVVDVLVRYFNKPPAEATRVMLQVHYGGIGIAGVYPREIAETKVTQVTEEAEKQQMPLLVTMEPE
jgi:ATP-dependent Clp protease adaptor protein ClpS